ncbi:MAG: hypothetical protein JNJ98_01380 [Gemmatimonadetes bacterium]|jgi:hypothetical protein|nr:hypothetical protein [Gemmatimonadota bacterium]MBL8958476.1 hypothetical protein [Gemmatimonadota bacterium]
MTDDTSRPERKNVLLRMLINEMLDQVRELQRHAAGPWDPNERARAEDTLERVMMQVRSEAVRRGGD